MKLYNLCKCPYKWVIGGRDPLCKIHGFCYNNCIYIKHFEHNWFEVFQYSQLLSWPVRQHKSHVFWHRSYQFIHFNELFSHSWGLRFLLQKLIIWWWINTTESIIRSLCINCKRHLMILDGKKPLKTMVCLEDNPYLLGPGYIFRTNILSKCPEGCTLKNKDFESKKWRWIGDFRSIFF